MHRWNQRRPNHDVLTDFAYISFIPPLTSEEGGVNVAIETPEFYNGKVRNGLRADAAMVDLPKLSPNFFRFGTQYLQL